jgi:hypothetical protein
MRHQQASEWCATNQAEPSTPLFALCDLSIFSKSPRDQSNHGGRTITGGFLSQKII